MTDRPYTDADLCAEAARQHKTLTEDPDFVGTGEQMEWTPIPSRPDVRWDNLDEEDFDAARETIHDLVRKAADTSEWAVQLGADGLKPDEYALTLAAGEKPFARVHFAFAPGFPDDARHDLAQYIAEAVSDELGLPQIGATQD